VSSAARTPNVAAPNRCADAAAVDAPQITGRAPACIRLVARDSSAAAGFVELHRVAIVAVHGERGRRVVISCSRRRSHSPISRAGTLGPYSTYVAWAVTPDLARDVKLGVVTNGRTEVGVVGLNQFLLMITAERSADVTRQLGPAILNGTSPSMALQPHDAPPITRAAPHAAMSMHGDAHPGAHDG
jgi:hypothetical protein